MKSRIIPVFAFCLAGFFFAAEAKTIPDLVSTVIYPQNASAVERHAAEELATHLNKACGGTIACMEESAMPSGVPAIYVGNTRFAEGRHLSFAGFSPEEWMIRSFPEGIVVGGGVPRGTLYGAYEFLERFADIAWLDEFYTDIPRKSRILLPESIDLRGKPVFRYRGIYTWHGNDQTRRFLFRSRNRENIFFEETLDDALKAAIGHTPVLGSPAPLNTLFYYINEWPATGFEECYSLDESGKRVRPTGVFGPGQVCFSSPRTQEKFTEQMIAYILQDREKDPIHFPLLYNLSVNDIKDICHCAGCQERAIKYGTHSGGMLEFVNAVAQSVTKIYPDVRIQTSAYLVYEAAPEKGIVPLPNVTVRCSPSRWGSGFDTMRSLTLPRNQKTLDELQKWSRIGSIQIWNYWVLFGDNPDKNACLINLEAIRDNLLTYFDLGADYVFSECEFPESTTFHAMRVWIGYKLKCDPSLPLARLIKRFMEGYYGAAAPHMGAYYDYLVKRQASAPELDTRGVVERDYLDAEFFRTVEPLLENALAAVSGDQERTLHILNERVPFDIARVICQPMIPEFKPDAAEVRKRLFNDWQTFCERYLTGITRGRSLEQMERFFQEYAEKKTGAKYPVPGQLDGKELYEITFAAFNQLQSMQFYGTRMNHDPEAAGGQAMGVDQSPRIADHAAFHAKEFHLGVQDRKNNKSLLFTNIPREQIYQDEKYHLYLVGTVELSPSTLLWMHESWYVQQNLSHFYTPHDPAGNRYQIYVSLKFCGSAYVKDSTSENAFWLDRVLLVREERGSLQ